MGKILRAFQVINQDGGYTISSTYNEVDENGNQIKKNAKDSFFVVDPELQSHIDAVEDFIKGNRLSEK